MTETVHGTVTEELPLSKLQHLLNGLKHKELKGDVYQQVSAYLSSCQNTQLNIEQEYTYLLRALVESLSRKLDEGTGEKNKAIQLLEHLQPTLSLSELQSLTEQIKAFTGTLPQRLHSPQGGAAPSSSSINTDINQLSQILSPIAQSLAGTEGGTTRMPTPPAHNETPENWHPAHTDAPGSATEHLVQRIEPPQQQSPTSYHAKLDEERTKIHKIQSDLHRRIKQAIEQHQMFGTHMKSELWALRSADDADQIEQIRTLLIHELEKILAGQHELVDQLNSTQAYLQAVECDSQHLNEELRRARRLSLTDDLTSLPNRRAFTQRLENELSRVQRSGAPLALAMIDLDRFKSINDKHGHSFGDAILRGYAELVLTAFRHHDLVARYGGEEFAAILPYTNRIDAVQALEKVRERAAQTVFDYDDTTLAMPTFSAGIALYQPGDTLLSLINRADKAMYRAKRMGRNCILTDDGNSSDDSADS